MEQDVVKTCRKRRFSAVEDGPDLTEPPAKRKRRRGKKKKKKKEDEDQDTGDAQANGIVTASHMLVASAREETVVKNDSLDPSYDSVQQADDPLKWRKTKAKKSTKANGSTATAALSWTQAQQSPRLAADTPCPSRGNSGPAGRKGALTEEEMGELLQHAESFKAANGLSDAIFNDLVQDKMPPKSAKVNDAATAADRRMKLQIAMWETLCTALRHRTRGQTVQIARKKFHNFVAQGSWTAQQDKELMDVYMQHPGQWAIMAKAINRHPSDVCARWKQRYAAGEESKSSLWSDEEEIELIVRYMDAVEHGKQLSRQSKAARRPDWGIIADSMSFSVTRSTCQKKFRSLGLEEHITGREPLACLQPGGPCWTLEKARRQVSAMTGKEKEMLVKHIRDCHEAVVDDSGLPWRAINKKVFNEKWHLNTLQLLWFRLRQSVGDDAVTPCMLAKELYARLAQWGRFHDIELNIKRETELLGSLKKVRYMISKKGLHYGRNRNAILSSRELFVGPPPPSADAKAGLASSRNVLRRTHWPWTPTGHDHGWYARAVMSKRPLRGQPETAGERPEALAQPKSDPASATASLQSTNGIVSGQAGKTDGKSNDQTPTAPDQPNGKPRSKRKRRRRTIRKEPVPQEFIGNAIAQESNTEMMMMMMETASSPSKGLPQHVVVKENDNSDAAPDWLVYGTPGPVPDSPAPRPRSINGLCPSSSTKAANAPTWAPPPRHSSLAPSASPMSSADISETENHTPPSSQPRVRVSQEKKKSPSPSRSARIVPGTTLSTPTAPASTLRECATRLARGAAEIIIHNPPPLWPEHHRPPRFARINRDMLLQGTRVAETHDGNAKTTPFSFGRRRKPMEEIETTQGSE